jgi:hypothetical protein
MEEEIFKDYEFDGMNYRVGNLGTVYGTRFLRPLKQRLNLDGYLEVTMGREKGRRITKRVHRLVAELFVPNPNNLPEVNHKDYNRSNPRYDNLEWISHSDNIKYSSKAGRFDKSSQGSNNGRAIVNEMDVLKIRELYENGTLRSEIAKVYGIGWTTVDHIVKRNTWTNV